MLKNMKEYSAKSFDGVISDQEVFRVLDQTLEQVKGAKRVLLVPPDITRCYSYAGKITGYCYRKLAKEAEVKIMPALGTHRMMTREEQVSFIGGDIPESAYLYHNWRTDTVKIGTIPAAYIEKISDGTSRLDIDAEVNKCLVDGSFDLILSIGQVVPHEVVGMANYSKNILVGLGGRQMINQSHMVGAIYNLENIMGETDTPVRLLFDYAEENFLKDVPLAYILTVTTEENHEAQIHGIFTGAARRPFEQAAELAKRWNITYLPKRVHKVVAYLEPEEFTSTWVGNKAIYRSRMIIEDGGELLVLAPGLLHFGENDEVDGLIRQYGYRGTPYALNLWKDGKFANADMVAAHIMHGSTEGRFTVTYATDTSKVTKEEVESIGYCHMDYQEAAARYDMEKLPDGYYTMPDGEEIYVIKTPALGLWKTLAKSV